MNVLDEYKNNISVSEIAQINGMTYKECQQEITSELVHLYESGMSIKGIARTFNKDKNTISVRIKPYITKRILKSDKRLSETDKQNIIRKYVVEGKSIISISEEIGFTVAPISNFIKKQNLKSPVYLKSEKIKSNVNLFNSSLLSCAESYLLGFISGDGHVSKHEEISFFNTDFDIIEKIKLYLPNFHLSKKETGYKPLYTLYKKDSYLAARMNYFGLDNRKSYSIRFPKHIEMNFSSYLRGLFDADGHISVFGDNLNKVQIGFTSGSKEFLEDLIEEIKKHLPEITRHTISLCKCRNSNTYQLKYSSKNALSVLRFIYSTKNNLYMKRKFDKYKLLVGS